MAYEIKGDLLIKRTGIFERRADQGLRSVTITAPETLTRHSAYWQSISAETEQNVTMPDATTLPNGWAIVIHASGTAGLNVRDAAGNLLKFVEPGNAYEFTLLNNTTLEGTWYIDSLGIVGNVPAFRYVRTHNATTDWTLVEDYYTITITASTHGMGTDPVVQYYETIGTDDIEVTPDRSLVNENGDITFRVPAEPDLRYAGKVVVM